MDKIDGNLRNLPFQPRRDENKKPRKAGETEKNSFLGFLKKTESETELSESGVLGSVSGPANEAEIERLLDQVHEVGQQLAQYPSPENVQNYRKKIAQFIKAIVHNSVELTEVEGRMRKDLKRPKYALLQIIDEKLEKLGAFVLQNQKEKLEILRRVDELHGLLIDLRH